MRVLGSGSTNVINFRQHIGYISVAGLCLACHNIVLIMIDMAGYPLTLGVLSSFATVALLGYVLHSFVTFREPLSWVGLQRYVSAMSLNAVCAFFVTWFCKDGLHLPMGIAAPLASLLMFVNNFLLSRWAIAATPKWME